MGVAAVVFFRAEDKEAGRRLAARFGADCLDASAVATAKAREQSAFFARAVGAEAVLMVVDAEGLHLRSAGPDALTVRVDFAAAALRYRRLHGGGRDEAIAKAVGLRSGVFPEVLDATAGLGGDAFVLAGLGCRVRLHERSPEVHALLEDGLRRRREGGDEELRRILDRMALAPAGDAGLALEGGQTDVVYLDPMFPQRRTRAQVRKEMQVFHRLVGEDPDADALLPAALRAARYRVAVKRPRIAPALAGPAPSHVLEGKRNRFDIYAKRRLPDGLGR